MGAALRMLSAQSELRASVVVPMPFMRGVTVSIMDVVDVVLVRDSHVPALRPVLVIMALMRGV